MLWYCRGYRGRTQCSCYKKGHLGKYWRLKKEKKKDAVIVREFSDYKMLLSENSDNKMLSSEKLSDKISDNKIILSENTLK